MILAAVVIGVLAAYFFGVKFGVYAAGAAALLLLFAFFVPQYSLPAYAILVLGITAIFVVGSRLERHQQNKNTVKWAKKVAARLWRKL